MKKHGNIIQTKKQNYTPVTDPTVMKMQELLDILIHNNHHKNAPQIQEYNA